MTVGGLRGLVVLVALAGCSADAAGPDAGGVTDAWARATPAGATVGVVYARIGAGGRGDALVGATVDEAIAGSVELHTTMTSGDGVVTMAEQPSLPVPPGGLLVLEPGGDHLMLVDLVAPLEPGETFEVELELETAGVLAVPVEVRDGAP